MQDPLTWDPVAFTASEINVEAIVIGDTLLCPYGPNGGTYVIDSGTSASLRGDTYLLSYQIRVTDKTTTWIVGSNSNPPVFIQLNTGIKFVKSLRWYDKLTSAKLLAGYDRSAVPGCSAASTYSVPTTTVPSWSDYSGSLDAVEVTAPQDPGYIVNGAYDGGAALVFEQANDTCLQIPDSLIAELGSQFTVMFSGRLTTVAGAGENKIIFSTNGGVGELDIRNIQNGVVIVYCNSKSIASDTNSVFSGDEIEITLRLNLVSGLSDLIVNGKKYSGDLTGVVTPTHYMMGFDGAYSFDGLAYGYYLYSGIMSDAEVNWTWQQLAPTLRTNIYMHANSLGAGIGTTTPATDNPAAVIASILSPHQVEVINNSTGGYSIAHLASQVPTAAFYSVYGPQSVLLFWEITNTIYEGNTADQAVDELWNYCDLARQYSRPIIVISTISRHLIGASPDEATATAREVQSNIRIRQEWSQHCHRFTDLRAVAPFNDWTNVANQAYYNLGGPGDYTHLNTLGAALAARYILVDVMTVLASFKDIVDLTA